ncbi:MAG: Antitoxin VbhA [Acidobacteriaceae bacterium]|nr:Antitoxin VbhA [Acidobacteriaceae bacterium]
MTDDEIKRRVEAMCLARHSNAMEGLRELPEDALVLDAFARGEIDGHEARRRIKARIALGHQGSA